MNFWNLYSLVTKNQKLALKRHPMFEKQTFMKVFVYIFIAFWACYLIFFGVAFGSIDDGGREIYDTVNGGMIWFLMLDFLVRFGMQETPAQEIKPYQVLPLKKNSLISIFLLRLGMRLGNLFWFFFFVPFGFLSVLPLNGFSGYAAYLLSLWLLFVCNGYWYLLWRTLINRNFLYSAIPILFYFLLIYFGIFYDEKNQWLFNASMYIGRSFIEWNALSYAALVLLIAVFWFINLEVQKREIYREISREENVQKVKSRQMAYLDRFGAIGEYMKLEIKSALRNKVIRQQVLLGLFYVLLMCCLLAFTDVYDNHFMTVFICVYSFSCFGVMTLTQVMCAEGNYMDLLMSRKESVMALLTAKYYFNCLVLILPFLVTLVPVFQGKLTLLDTIGCMFFSSGVMFPCLFILAIYNNHTLHLNTKVTKSGQSTKTQMIVSFAAMFVPIILMNVLVALFSSFVAALVMLILGVAGTVLHRVWLRTIYKRFMDRRYVNMSGFRDSR